MFSSMKVILFILALILCFSNVFAQLRVIGMLPPDTSNFLAPISISYRHQRISDTRKLLHVHGNASPLTYDTGFIFQDNAGNEFAFQSISSLPLNAGNGGEFKIFDVCKVGDFYIQVSSSESILKQQSIPGVNISRMDSLWQNEVIFQNSFYPNSMIAGVEPADNQSFWCLSMIDSTQSALYKMDTLGNILSAHPISTPMFWGGVYSSGKNFFQKVNDSLFWAISENYAFLFDTSGTVHSFKTGYFTDVKLRNDTLFISGDSLYMLNAITGSTYFTKELSYGFSAVLPTTDGILVYQFIGGNVYGDFYKYDFNGQLIYSSPFYVTDVFGTTFGGGKNIYLNHYSSGIQEIEINGFRYYLAEYTNYIRGKVQMDSNQNGLVDATDVILENIKIKIFRPSDGQEWFTYSSSDGYFESWLDTGNYVISVLAPHMYPTQTIPVWVNGQDTSIRFLALQWNDASLIDNPQLFIKNNGTNTWNGQAIIQSFSTGPFTPAPISTMPLVWNLSITDSLRILPALSPPYYGNLSPDDQNANNYVFKRGVPLDPNFKEVNLASVLPSASQNEEWLYYNLGFQNTGTDTAFHVTVIDSLPSNLQWQSLELSYNTHPVKVSVVNDVATFFFENIQLPDTHHSLANSQGYFGFRIKMKSGLFVGDSIANRVGIYFDHEKVVYTNYAVTHIDSVVKSEKSLTKESIDIYPNPTQDVIYLSHLEKNSQIEVYDFQGRLVHSFYNQNSSESISLKNVCSGFYLVKVEHCGKIWVYKVNKE